MPEHLATLGLKPPPPDAPKSAKLRFVRDIQLRALPFNVLCLGVLAAVGVDGWLVAVGAVAVGVLVLDILLLTFMTRGDGGDG